MFSFKDFPSILVFSISRLIYVRSFLPVAHVFRVSKKLANSYNIFEYLKIRTLAILNVDQYAVACCVRDKGLNKHEA